MRWITLAAALLVTSGGIPAAQRPSGPWSVASPDGRTAIAVTRQADGALRYGVTRDARTVLAESPLGIRRADQAFDTGLTLVGATARDIADRYTTPHGKRKDHVVSAREAALTFANAAGARIEIVLRAQNDGVAFRYRFPGPAADRKTVVEELTGFHVPPGSAAWMLPQSPVGKYGPAYEDFFVAVPAGTASERPDGWAFPALFRTPSGPWVLLTESALDET